MKLREIEHQGGYRFLITFINGEVKEADLTDLISKHVSLKNISTAYINKEWGCLEFNNGAVDIEPKTLYNYTKNHSDKIH